MTEIAVFQDVLNRSTLNGLDTLIDFDGGDSIRLVGVNKTDLAEDDFVF